MHLNLTDHFSRPSLEHFTNDFQETKTQVIRSVPSQQKRLSRKSRNGGQAWGNGASGAKCEHKARENAHWLAPYWLKKYTLLSLARDWFRVL